MMTAPRALREFEALLEVPQNDLVGKAVSDGRIPIGYSCSFVPEPLLMADRLFPVRLHATGIAGTEIADNYLSTFVCSYTRSLLEYAFDDRYDLIRGWVFVPSCAHMQRLEDNFKYLKKPEFSHTIDVPRKVTSATIDWMEEELHMLSDRLSSHFQVDMGSASLNKAITTWNDYVKAVRDIGELRKRPEPPLTGEEFHAMVMASLASPKDLILPKIKAFREEAGRREGISGRRARLLLVGGHLHDPEFIRVLESQGGLVVSDRFCTGSIPGLMPVEMNSDDPIRTLAEHVFKKTLCPRMMEDFDLRLQAVIDAVHEYRADGVVIEIIKFCDLWGVDSMPLVTELRQKGIPVLKLEREYRLGGEGQMRTRVQAFIESMGR